ncbi:hypothetical protein IFM89_018211 [Coptis chinensis]|uniref:BRCT domain-containing protein n=1 Tax=Coptis chinensis TaxID=261450 RepID=A0A835I5V3_9MAGN|nr:hypothetical protein IFM89_018211 [Coptis chinensis]
MKMTRKPFTGSNVFVSRSLVQPEVFDSIHDALNQNGAKVFLCCDPWRTAPNDYHVISSSDHEKFEALKEKGCNLLGPQCVLSCAKEKRNLPERKGYTCCLAMDGVKLLASGFDKQEKVKIEKLVNAMGGIVQTRASMDVSFVIAKNVLAAKYKWALMVLKKPIVTINWLNQCWNEHRVVPQESYKVLPFSGLTICITRAKAVPLSKGAKYAPEGDKYKVARKWGSIHIVTPKWLEQSIARRACLEEESYSVRISCTSSASIMIGGSKGGLMAQHRQDKANTDSQSVPSSVKADLETTFSQNMSSTFSDSTIFINDEESEVPDLQPGDETNFDDFVADDSQKEDNDLYLSDCRILFVGFQASEMRKLVNLVRKGGGSRYMSFSERLTHIVVGTPSENEKKELRHHAALGIIYIVKSIWLEDCDRERKEVPVSQRHVSDVLLPKEVTGISAINQGKTSTGASILPTCQVKTSVTFEKGLSFENVTERNLTANLEGSHVLQESAKSRRQDQFCLLNDDRTDQKELSSHPGTIDGQERRLSDIFKGLQFRFSSSFPEDCRAEIVEWVNQGGGLVVDNHIKRNAQFTIETHGLGHRPSDVSDTTIVSSHWIKSCLEDGCLHDVRSHIIYSPLRCRVPFPGFECFRFCVSQYEEKDRKLLRNLCYVLGAKFTEKLSKRVTHLLCKFSSGPKYEAACKWEIQSVTSEWISECVRQDSILPIASFRPKAVTAQDREAGLCTMSQYPTQAARMTFGDIPSQLPTQSQVQENISSHIVSGSNSSKRARLVESITHMDLRTAKVHEEVPTVKVDSMRNNIAVDVTEASHSVPDVAAAIEDLLAQSNKIQDMATQGDQSVSDQSSLTVNMQIISPDRSKFGQDHVDSRSAFGVFKHWKSRTDKQDDLYNPSGQVNQGPYDVFSETQTESQVVSYEEDLSGRQMIIDRVRTRSSLT